MLVVGGGLAAQRCCETLRRHGYDGRIVVLCEEPHLPLRCSEARPPRRLRVGERSAITLIDQDTGNQIYP